MKNPESVAIEMKATRALLACGTAYAVRLQIYFVCRQVIGQRPVLTGQEANLVRRCEEFKFLRECSIDTFGHISTF